MVTENYYAISVAYANPQMQRVLELEVAPGTTVEQAIYASGILQAFPEIDLAEQAVGIFSQQVALEHRVAAGDRIEIYRALLIDPKQARRLRVQRKNK